MTNDLVGTPGKGCTLYELEDYLQALASSIALAEDEPTRQLILEEIGLALHRTKEKRDGVVAFLRHCEQQQRFADEEIERIEKRKAFIASVGEQLERYVVHLIEQLAPVGRTGIQRLEGNVSSMRIQKNPDSVVITDMNAIPAAYKWVTISMPAYVWETLLLRVGTEDRKVFESHVRKVESRADKKAIAAELKNGITISGADLKFGGHRLVIS
jgi:hypothetical protein